MKKLSGEMFLKEYFFLVDMIFNDQNLPKDLAKKLQTLYPKLKVIWNWKKKILQLKLLNCIHFHKILRIEIILESFMHLQVFFWTSYYINGDLNLYLFLQKIALSNDKTHGFRQVFPSYLTRVTPGSSRTMKAEVSTCRSRGKKSRNSNKSWFTYF